MREECKKESQEGRLQVKESARSKMEGESGMIKKQVANDC